MKKSNTKVYFKTVIITTISLLLLLAMMVIIIDPMMHYHKPFSRLCYVMKDEFFLNPGIASKYDYDAIIVGDSSCQNFLTSIIKDERGLEAVKLTNTGAPFSESDEILRYAFKCNPDIKLVVRAVDSLMLSKDPDIKRYPKKDYYLYDDNVFNDVRYIFNIEMYKKCFTILNDTRLGKKTWNMDMYSNWEDFRDFGGYEMLLASLEGEPTVDYTDEALSIANAKENVLKNIVKTAREHQDTEFIVFMPPYHLAYYKSLLNASTFDTEFKVQKVAIETLIDEPNIKLYSFCDDYEITTDWSYYCDMVHSKQDVNSRILEMMLNDQHRITKDNYLDYLTEIKSFYSDFDYSTLIKEED
ncbi:MAG: hypothetical protein MJ123_11040 [Lachnospiraceae bacterium]|nr:hypothetical protein [Lachnospiraceae bacterium]